VHLEDTDFIHVSQGAEVAIIVVVVLVAVIGRKSFIPSPGQDVADIGIVASALLFYLAKKRQWEVRRASVDPQNASQEASSRQLKVHPENNLGLVR
jgi:hypothetical protein